MLSRGHVAEAWRGVTGRAGGLAAAEVLTIIPQSGHFIFISAIFSFGFPFLCNSHTGRPEPCLTPMGVDGKADRSFRACRTYTRQAASD
jgi:hypothetical protein